MRQSYAKNKGRNNKAGRHLQLPYIIYQGANYAKLSAYDVKLLVDIAMQFNGQNNGDLTATWSIMKKLGWRSKGTLHQSIKQLLQHGFIEVTRQGGRNQCSLYAISWRSIDECKGKLDVRSTTVASNKWKNEN